MANVSVYNMEGKEVGTMELNDAVYAAPINEHLVHMAVTLQLANKRQGTQKAKTRSEVSGGGRKPWRQKGTGHARQGSTRSPQWTGGGVVFAPVPRSYSFKMNKKEKAAAMRSVLSAKVSDNKFVVVDNIAVEEYKTKTVVSMLEALDAKKALIILDNADEKFIKVVNEGDTQLMTVTDKDTNMDMTYEYELQTKLGCGVMLNGVFGCYDIDA